MRLVTVKGKNYRNYIEVKDITREDLQYFKLLEKVVSRKEFKPFSRSINKTVSESYFIDKTYIPAQFAQDIRKKFFPAYPHKLTIENFESILNMSIDKQDFRDYCDSLVLPEYIDLWAEEYSYQTDSVFNSLLFKTARIEVGTGGGKTLITYMYSRYLAENFVQPDKKILIIVPKVDLVKQTKAAFEEFQEFQDVKIPIDTIYSGAKRIQNAKIVIGTWQSLKEYDTEYFDDFSVLICDEAHSAKAYSIRVDIYNKCKNVEFVFGMTGTYPEYETIDYLNVVAMFGPNVYTKTTKELIADGNVCPVLINKLLIKYDEDKDFSKNLIASGITGGEKYRIEKKFFQNHLARLNLIKTVIDENPYNHLILVENVEYVHKLQEYLTENCPDWEVEVIYGDIRDRDSIKNRMKEINNMILIATYETMSTGVSINNIMHVHFPDGGRSPIRIKQSVGRGLRLHAMKEYLNVWDYQDMLTRSSFQNHAGDRNKIYEKEGHPFEIFHHTI